MDALDEHSFALCLTHDVDRVKKTYQCLYFAVQERDPRHLMDLAPWRRPYWRFDDIMAIESDLGVRSAFYFLDEQWLFADRPVSSWFSPEAWKLYAGRYEVDSPDIAEVISTLDEGGWEVGLHGSYESYNDRDRLAVEKDRLESVLGHSVLGGRQHYLNLDRPLTWRYHTDIGLQYDTTLGSAQTYGFQYGYDPIRPFDDDFIVFPLTLMEKTLPNIGDDPEGAWSECERLLDEAAANGAVMTVLWHPSYFSDHDHPNYRSLYRRLIRTALDKGAWVGPPGDLYRAITAGTDKTVSEAVGRS